MHRPEALSGSGLFKWSVGDSSDIWNLLVASADGDLALVNLGPDAVIVGSVSGTAR